MPHLCSSERLWTGVHFPFIGPPLPNTDLSLGRLASWGAGSPSHRNRGPHRSHTWSPCGVARSAPLASLLFSGAALGQGLGSRGRGPHNMQGSPKPSRPRSVSAESGLVDKLAARLWRDRSPKNACNRLKEPCRERASAYRRKPIIWPRRPPAPLQGFGATPFIVHAPPYDYY